MKIKIAERLRPFCHLPGTSCMIPWSVWKVDAYPTILRFENLVTHEKHDHHLHWKGPVNDFTVELDLEKAVVWVYGKTGEGYRKLCIQAEGNRISVEKKFPIRPFSIERLSLGMSKKLDWELVRRRRSMAEVLPIWHHLGQIIPLYGEGSLHYCEKTEVAGYLRNIFLEEFEGILVPRRRGLLTGGANYIRSLFFHNKDNHWEFLPCLAPEFHSGRFLDLAAGLSKIDFEWSKKLLKKVIIRSGESRQIFIHTPKPLTSCRLRSTLRQKGTRHSLDNPLTLTPGQTIFLDRFEK